MTFLKENDFNRHPKSNRYPGSNIYDTLPVASTSDESRYMNDRIDTLRKPGASFAALKELVSCCLHCSFRTIIIIYLKYVVVHCSVRLKGII